MIEKVSARAKMGSKIVRVNILARATINEDLIPVRGYTLVRAKMGSKCSER